MLSKKIAKTAGGAKAAASKAKTRIATRHEKPIGVFHSDDIPDVLAVVKLVVVGGRNIPALKSRDSLADAFALIGFEDTVMKTSTQKNTSTPSWNQEFYFFVAKGCDKHDFLVSIFDKEKTHKNHLIGHLSIDAASIIAQKDTVTSWYKLSPALSDTEGPADRGEVQITSSVLSREEIEKRLWTRLASLSDKNDNGIVDLAELEELVKAFGVQASHEQLAQLFEKYDVDKNGNLDVKELGALLSSFLEFKVTCHMMVETESDGPSFLTTDQASRGWMCRASEWVSSNQYGVVADISEASHVIIIDRETGAFLEEQISSQIRLINKAMYTSRVGRCISQREAKLLKKSSIQQGVKFDSPESVDHIKPTVQRFQIDMSQFEPSNLDAYHTFNEWFYRKLKPNARPIASPDDPTVAVAAADCRLNVFPTVTEATRLWIKGKNFSIANLLHDNTLAAKYEGGGSVVIFRLAPQDYHRFHFPVDAVVGKTTELFKDGKYFTVNPMAVREEIDIFTENKRCYTLLQSKEFGQIVFIAIGAVHVGSITVTTQEGQTVKKGDEHGFFAFGGSTCIALFEPGTITFDDDLLKNSLKPVETLVKMGMPIGRATKK